MNGVWNTANDATAEYKVKHLCVLVVERIEGRLEEPHEAPDDRQRPRRPDCDQSGKSKTPLPLVTKPNPPRHRTLHRRRVLVGSHRRDRFPVAVAQAAEETPEERSTLDRDPDAAQDRPQGIARGPQALGEP